LTLHSSVFQSPTTLSFQSPSVGHGPADLVVRPTIVKYTITRFTGVNEVKFGLNRDEIQEIIKDKKYNIVEWKDKNSQGLELHYDEIGILHGVVLHNPDKIEYDGKEYSIPDELTIFLDQDNSHYYYHLGTEIFPKLGVAIGEYGGKISDIKILIFDEKYFDKDGWNHKFKTT